MSYEYRYVRFTSPKKEVDGYDTGAIFALSDGEDLKENYIVPNNPSVAYDGRLATTSSDLNTGVELSDIGGVAGEGPSSLSIKFRALSVLIFIIIF